MDRFSGILGIAKKNVDPPLSPKSFKQVKAMVDADHHISGPYSSFVTPKSANDSYLQAVANHGKLCGLSALIAKSGHAMSILIN